jgi:hypothetical protein
LVTKQANSNLKAGNNQPEAESLADLRQLIRYYRNHGFGERTRSISAHSSGRLTLLDLRQELAGWRCMPWRI